MIDSEEKEGRIIDIIRMHLIRLSNGAYIKTPAYLVSKQVRNLEAYRTNYEARK